MSKFVFMNKHKRICILLCYYSKPSESSIRDFMIKQAEKARFDSEIA